MKLLISSDEMKLTILPIQYHNLTITSNVLITIIRLSCTPNYLKCCVIIQQTFIKGRKKDLWRNK